MEDLPQFLQYGQVVTYASHDKIFAVGDPVGDKPIYYVIARPCQGGVPACLLDIPPVGHT